MVNQKLNFPWYRTNRQRRATLYSLSLGSNIFINGETETAPLLLTGDEEVCLSCAAGSMDASQDSLAQQTSIVKCHEDKVKRIIKSSVSREVKSE